MPKMASGVVFDDYVPGLDYVSEDAAAVVSTRWTLQSVSTVTSVGFSESIKNNIRTSFSKQMYYGRAVSNNPHIHLLRFTISGGDSAMGIEGTEVDNSQYFVESDIDNYKITEVPLKFDTSMGPASQMLFYIPSTPVYYNDIIEYGPEMRVNAHLYDKVLMCDTARFQSNGVRVGDSIKIFSNPITGGDYVLDMTDIITSITSETEITLSAGIGITGVTRAYSVNTKMYDIVSILPDDEYDYIMIQTERQGSV